MKEAHLELSEVVKIDYENCGWPANKVFSKVLQKVDKELSVLRLFSLLWMTSPDCGHDKHVTQWKYKLTD